MSGKDGKNASTLASRLETLEKSNQWYLFALDLAASMASLHGESSHTRNPHAILLEAQNHLQRLINYRFQATAFFTVTEENSDFQLATCAPDEAREELQALVERLVENGEFSWALKQNRLVLSTLKGNDGASVLLHVLATKSRVRGMFVGLLGVKGRKLPGSFLDLLSILFNNTAHALESAELYRLLDDLNQNLELKLREGLQRISSQNRELQDKVAELQHARARITRNLQTRIVLNSLLAILLEPMPLRAHLALALERILAVDWLALEKRGAIFLANDAGNLEMIAQTGLSPFLLATCRGIAPGVCLCGRAALQREVIFASEVDERHDIHYDGMRPHGHYCVPILSRGQVLGVLNLYLAHGHQADAEEVEFLQAVSNTLAGIIERSRVDEELKRTKEAAEAANRAKTFFLANVSHEIRTPLNAILGFSQILLKDRGQLPERHVRYLENIQVSGANLVEIISNVLDLSKIEAGKHAVEEEPLDVGLMVKSLYAMHRARAWEKGLVFNYHLDPELPTMILADRAKVNQIVANLLGNAIKFTASGGEVTLHAEAVRQDDQEWLCLRVSDQGIGIPENKLIHIFEPFEQADASTTRRYGGTGLGLAIVKALVTTLQGRVEVRSQPGAGSVFTVHLPLKTPVASDVEPRATDWPSFHFTGAPAILLVEDNAMNREMLTAALRGADLAVIKAENGALGVEQARAAHPALILMDLHMPVMDGFDAARALRQDPRTAAIPIIGLSADAFVERREEALALGIQEFLTKPVDLARLFAVLARHLPLAGEAPDTTATPLLPPLPVVVRQELLLGLRELAAIPLYDAARIVAHCDALITLCRGYASPVPELLHPVREAVFSRNSRRIPELITQALSALSL